MEEEWRHIPGFPEQYQASSLGRVRNKRKRGKCYTLTLSGSYYVIQMYKKQQKVNRLVCAAFHGPAPSSKHHAAHKNGIGTDNREENLYWGTAADNGADLAKHGSLKCDAHPLAKLTLDDVLEIRFRRASGEKILDIHKDYKHVCYATLSHICNGRTWNSRKSIPSRRETVGMEL